MNEPRSPTEQGLSRTSVMLLAGAALGGISGSITGCELSSFAGSFDGGCAPGGALTGAVVGALVAGVAAPLGRSRTQPNETATRPHPTTVCAAALIVAITAYGASLWVAAWRVSEGLEEVGVGALGLVVALGSIWTVSLALGVVRRRGWARWGAVVSFGLCLPPALAALLATATNVGRQDPGRDGGVFLATPSDLVPSIVFVIASLALIILLLVPTTRRDF